MIFQDHHLLLSKTVFDNVALPLTIEGYSRSDVRRRVAAALDLVGLYGKEDVFPRNVIGWRTATLVLLELL